MGACGSAEVMEVEVEAEDVEVDVDRVQTSVVDVLGVVIVLVVLDPDAAAVVDCNDEEVEDVV